MLDGLSLVLSGAIALAASCHRAEIGDHEKEAENTALLELQSFEAARKQSTDFERRPSSDRVLGADPYLILRPTDGVIDGGGYVGLLRNAGQVVLLDESLHERARAPAPALASGLALGPNGLVVAGGESSGIVRRYRITGHELVDVGELDLSAGDPSRGIRALATHPSGTLYGIDEVDDRLLVAPPGASIDGGPADVSSRVLALEVPEGPMRVAATEHYLVIVSLIAHALSVYSVDAEGKPVGAPTVVTHDGPFWSIAPREVAGELVVAAGGVEDHPLDRTGGSFAFVDPFVFFYRFHEGEAERLGSVDVGELGVITPKALAWAAEGRSLRVVGYGSALGADLHFPFANGAVDYRSPDASNVFAVTPGLASITWGRAGEMVGADPLLDAFVRVTETGNEVVPVPSSPAAPERTDASRLGEALFFTNLLAPWQKSEGPLSRFTCETCHFEGTVDGRTHATGRGAVIATTKPLLGLFGNGPHFSRALDANLARMVNAEFRVASANSGHGSWFTLDEARAGLDGRSDRSFVDELGGDTRTKKGQGVDRSPEGMRRAFMEFLMDFSPRPNPRVMGRASFSSVEREGAELFAERCASCHSPRRVADDPSTVVPFEAWEADVFGHDGSTPGSIVWAREGYEKTGIEPYVHAEGARPTSLRRLEKKRPYFTNGSARTLHEVLDEVRFSNEAFWHDASQVTADDLDALGDDDEAALLAFLRLL